MGVKLEAGPEAADNVVTPSLTSVSVSGMTCSGCARRVADAIQAVPGVNNAAVDLDSGRETVRWTPGASADPGSVFRAIRQAGYEPRLSAASKTELTVTGMTCSGGARNVSDALR